MTGEILAEHNDGDRHLTVMRPRRGSGFQLVVDGPGGVETVIRFDEVEIAKVNVEFYRRIGNRIRVEIGSIEPDLDAWSAVGEWLRSHALETPNPAATC